MKLANKVAIVTGAASGFGEGIAKRFAGEGAKIVVADLNDDGGARVVAEIEQAGGTATYIHTDVAVWEDIAAAVVFFSSDEASYVTGETMHVNGGMIMV